MPIRGGGGHDLKKHVNYLLGVRTPIRGGGGHDLKKKTC